jgi:hypothetical protein
MLSNTDKAALILKKRSSTTVVRFSQPFHTRQSRAMSKRGSRHNHSVHITHHTTWQRRQQATHRWKALGSPKYGVLDLAAYLATGMQPSKRERKQHHCCSLSTEVSPQIPSNIKTQKLDLRQTRPPTARYPARHSQQKRTRNTTAAPSSGALPAYPRHTRGKQKMST